MPSCVRINSEEKIKRIILGFDGTIQISRLEHTIKDNLFFTIESWIHTLECSIEYSIFIMTVGS